MNVTTNWIPRNWGGKEILKIFPFTKGPSLNHEKQPQTIIPHPPNFTVGTLHSSFGLKKECKITRNSSKNVFNLGILFLHPKHI
jgi:hypothetical protein